MRLGFSSLLCLTLLVISAWAAPASAEMEYCAFGDSITRGRGDDPINDCDASPTIEPWCGYPPKLDSLHDSFYPSIVTKVGVGGETLIEGAARINSLLKRGGSCRNDDVLLLMEGTNDVTQIDLGNETLTAAVNALKTIADVATTYGVETTHATIVPRTPSSDNDANNAITKNLNNQIRSYAANKDRWLAETYNAFLTGGGAVNTALYSDKIHPDGSGYILLRDLFNNLLNHRGLPPAAEPGAPLGDIGDSTPLFTWTDIGDVATWSWVIIKEAASQITVFAYPYERRVVCGGGSCSVDPSIATGMDPLTPGDYDWRLWTRNPGGYGPVSSTPSPFTVWETPGTPVPGEPAGNICNGTNPLFQWNGVTQATDFHLELTGSAVETFDYAAADICAGGICSTTAAAAFSPGPYSWRLRASNPYAGFGDWSSTQSFDVVAAPPRPDGSAPQGDLFDGTPDFEWPETANATRYRLQVSDAMGVIYDQWHEPSAVCAGGNCSVTIPTAPFPLAAGSYSWKVRAANGGCNGDWSWADAFDVFDAAPGLASLLSPRHDIFDTQPTLRWAHRAGAAEYRVVLDRIGTPTSLIDSWSTEASLCTDGICALAAGTLLEADHQWSIQTRNPFGTGPTTAPRPFTVLSCAAFPNRALNDGALVITSIPPERACQTLQVGPSYGVGDGGELTVHGGTTVRFVDGFSIDGATGSGKMTVLNDP